MHAILTSAGTDGDLIPYVGIGTRLKARGHRVTLAANEHVHPLAAQQGFEFHPLVFDTEYRELLSNPDIWHPTRSALLGVRWGKALLRRQYELIVRLAADPDSILVANPGVLAARLAGEKLGRPLVSVVLQPWLIPSAYCMPTMPGRFRLPRWAPPPVVTLYIRAVNALGDVLLGGDLNRLRRELRLPSVRQVFRWWLSPQRVIGLFPDWYGMPQADWPPQLRLAGFPLFDGRPDAPLDPASLDFCRAGEPPIAFTLGTGNVHASDFFRTAAEVCERLSRRGIFLTQFQEQLPQPLPPQIRHWSFAPFLQLFPHCAAVVHHGGIGTTAKALAAGIPQLILPLAFDQMDNARRVQELGAGDSLKANRRSVEDMARALGGLLQPAMQARCRELALRYASSLQQDALDAAANWIEQSQVSNLKSQI